MQAESGGSLEAEYGRLVAAEYRFVYRLHFWLHHDCATAEDLTQTTFLRAWQALRGRRSGAHSDRAWLAAIARRVSIDHSRRRVVPTSPLEAAGSVQDPRLPVAQQVEDRDGEAQLMRAVFELPEPYRSALVLTRLEELSVAEAAQALHAPQGTIKWRVFRALQILRARLEDQAVTRSTEVSHAIPESASH